MLPNEKVNIMLVNDNPNDLVSMEAILADLDENIVKAASGEEALRHLLSMEFAVIILDVKMPGMDGFETARMIRQRQQTRHIPIIFVTAYAHSDLDRLKGYEVGAVDYLFTPLIPDMLRSKVSVFIDLFRTTRTVQEQAVRLAEANQKLYDAHQEMTVICNELYGITTKLVSNVEVQSRQFKDVEEIYRGIFENVLEGIFQITTDGSIILANPAFVSMLGYDSYEEFTAAVINIFQQIFVDHNYGEEFRQKLSAAGMVHGFEASIYTKDKGIIWVSLSANAVYGKDSRLHYEGIILNITERKELEKKLIRAERAEAAAELAAETAHEIRNPLQVIRAGIYLLKETVGKENETASLTIKQIDAALMRAAKFIDEIMDSSRIPELDIIHVDINKFLPSSIQKISIPSPITMDWDMDSSLPNITADPERLHEIILNLVKNAIESMKQVDRDKRLTIRTELEKGFVKITISDTGKGMSEDELAKMWTPFYTAKPKGKGLGMSVVKRLIEAHKGKIDVKSRVGEGTTVVLRLVR